MIKINLVPEVQEKKLKVRKMNTYSTFAAVIIIGLTVFVLLVIGIWGAVKKASLRVTEERIASTNKELEQYKELEEVVLSLEKGLSGIKAIINGENDILKVIAHVENASPAEVIFKNLRIKEGIIEAELESKTVEETARFIESIQAYEVLTISGSGEAGQEVVVQVDGVESKAKVNSSGLWKLALMSDSVTDHTVKINSSNTLTEIKYDPITKKFNENSNGIAANIKRLFSSVEAKQYNRQNGVINFDAKMTYEGSLLW